MVCDVCNGKGYVVAHDHELPCPECLGRGDYPASGGELRPEAAGARLSDEKPLRAAVNG